LNNINNIITYNKGIFNKNINGILKKHDNNSGSYVMEELKYKTEDSIEFIKLDDMNITNKVDFIKIDTEGSELFVLEGSKQLICKNKPLIQVETNMCSNKFFNYDKTKIFEFLFNLGYEILDDDGNDPIFIYNNTVII